jgi:predicted aspartyl protease
VLWTKWTCSLCVALLASLPSLSCPGGPCHKTDRGEKPAEIPFELYNDHLIIVKGTIGSVKNVNIMLDTGKTPSAISKEIAGRLNLRGNTESLLFSNGRVEVQSVTLPCLDVGVLHLDSARVVVQDLGFLKRRLGIAIGGIAGLDLLSTGSFMIDYGKKKIVFEGVKAATKSVRFERQRPFLIVKANVEGQEVRLLVDSGTAGLLIYRNRLTKSPEPLPTDQDALVSTAAGPMHTAWFRASQVSLGKVNWGPQIMLIADVDPDRRLEFDGLLGFTKMGFRKVWLDFDNGLFGWD